TWTVQQRSCSAATKASCSMRSAHSSTRATMRARTDGLWSVWQRTASEPRLCLWASVASLVTCSTTSSTCVGVVCPCLMSERVVDLTLSKVPDHIMARAQMCSDRLGIPVFVNCMPDAPDGVLVTAGRNPNACSAEALVFLNYIPAELKKYKGQGRCFLLERIAEQLSYLNGGDMDD